MAINKRFTQLNNSGSNHNLLDALSGKITGSLEVTGSAYFPGGLSGSLQMLTDGTTMFLTGAGGVTITNLANGQIEVSSSVSAGAASPEYWTSDVANAIWTSGSVLARGGDTTTAASDYGTDTFFFVSGVLGGIGSSGVAAFGGDLVVSGSMRIGDGGNGFVGGGDLFVSGAIFVGNPGIPGASIIVETSDVNTNIEINKSDSKSISISKLDFINGSDDMIISSGSVVIRQKFGSGGGEKPVLTIDANTIAYTVSAGGSADTLGITSAGDITLDATDNIFVTASNGMYVGANTVFNAGLTGSLQEVSAGVPYLLAGDYITIATNSLGQIEITGSAGSSSPEYWTSDVANNIFTTGSIAVTGSATFNPAGAGRGLLRVGTLDISPLTGSAITADIAITPYSPSSSLDGNLISSSVGLYANGTPFIMRHEIQMLGLGLDLLGGGYYNVFSATYLVMSFVNPNGVLEVLSATELARDASGSYAANWDVNFAANGNIEVTGSMGAVQLDPEDTIINWYGQVTKEMALTLSGSRS